MMGGGDDNTVEVEAFKCWNLERVIDAELACKPGPEELLSVDHFVNEGEPITKTDKQWQIETIKLEWE